MRFDKILLKKDGLFSKEWNRKTKKYTTKPLLDTENGLFMAWNDPLTIQGTVRLHDLVRLLQGLETHEIKMLECLTGANLTDYLITIAETPKKRDRDKDPLIAIEVYRWYDLTNGERLDTWTFADSISAHGIAESGTAYAIEFTPWIELLHLPLRLAESTIITKTTYVKDKKRKIGFVKKNGKPEPGLSWTTDKKFVSNDNYPIQVTYTLGDFFIGLFDELCFFWTPARRDTEKEILQERLVESKKAHADGSDDFSELKEIE